MTNGDKIRKMSDEELAEIIMCPYDSDGSCKNLDDKKGCIQCSLEWLQKKEEENPMKTITTEFAEYICDMVCGNLHDVKNQEDADRICNECKLDEYIRNICHEYTAINYFEKSQIAVLLKEIGRLKEYKELDEKGLLLKSPCKVGDKVYHVIIDSAAEPPIYISESKIQDVSAKAIYFADDWWTFEEMQNLNVFLSREEAEQALEKMKGLSNEGEY